MIDYLIQRTLKAEGADSQEAKQVARLTNQWICEHFNLLTLPGAESKILVGTVEDLEDAQIALAATTLGEDYCLLTEDKSFCTLLEVPLVSPSQLLVVTETTEANQPIPVLDLAPQRRSLLPELERALRSVIQDGKYIMGPEVKRFEEEVAAYLGVKHAIAVNSGTDALVIGLKALGIGAGDEVITTPFSFFATAESISTVGAKPIFVDIDPLTFNIDPTQIEAKITPQTAAIMPVHLYGHPAAMAQILAIAQKYDLKVIEDCAQAFGARYFQEAVGSEYAGNPKISDPIRGQAVGSIGDVGAYSFFPSKNLGAYGDGGLITTDQDAVAEQASMLRVHGARKKYHNEVLGYNSRLDTIQAAILRVKLPHINLWNQARRQAAQFYNELLSSVPGIVTPHLVEGHVFHQYTIRVLDGKRDALQQKLAEQGIGSMIYYPVPQDQLPVYQGQYESYEISTQLSQEVLSLPIWPEIEPEKQAHIVKVLISSLS
ncbi:MAG: DegT/DnrJ/EryC1/StrS family aminotransferase [Acaryochloris sp. SU_5_25]|nr:DegT/DnrJ/EryC1/StrS family aminotransferase [Acaryochloris sp. SU_5_25]